MKNKFAFTLIELLVYIAIMGFIIVVAGRAFSDSTTMRVRSQSMVKTSEIVGKISNLIYEDISQMGVKEWGAESGIVFKIDHEEEVYMNRVGKDSSSYNLRHDTIIRNGDSAFFDRLTFRKAEFDKTQGKFLGVREITWEVEHNNFPIGKLLRYCRTLSPATGVTDTDLDLCPETGEKRIAIADSVVKFRLTPSAPGIVGNVQDDTLFGGSRNPDFSLLSRNDGGATFIMPNSDGFNEVKISGFSQNPNTASKDYYNQFYLAEGNLAAFNWKSCYRFEFKKGETYAIDFEMPFREKDVDAYYSTQFLPGRDHLAIGLRTYDGAVISDAPNDILFYPPQFPNAKNARHIEFSVTKDINNACLAITLAYYSPQANSGRLDFRNFNVLRKLDAAFHFPKEPNYGAEGSSSVNYLKDKKNAKAFELILEIRHRGEKAGTYLSSEDGKKGMLITTPGNGIIAPQTKEDS
jgi:hypothetical protein